MDKEPVWGKTVSSPENRLAWRRGFQDDNRYVDILKGLKHYGAKLPEKDRAKVLSFFERIRNIPAALRPEKIDMDAISDFINNW